ncbi:hypothetical protein EVAR_11502_1 [Eumeta japonica]|uniref:Uncharacterized protein n=1 Tax=Eumeta variegata TaxID=151549 RepID=A0A4C1TYW1_EUMVA|nr:hypothetical protein EVAR_11502_1 [Eumeta japonica]
MVNSYNSDGELTALMRIPEIKLGVHKRFLMECDRSRAASPRRGTGPLRRNVCLDNPISLRANSAHVPPQSPPTAAGRRRALCTDPNLKTGRVRVRPRRRKGAASESQLRAGLTPDQGAEPELESIARLVSELKVGLEFRGSLEQQLKAKTSQDWQRVRKLD